MRLGLRKQQAEAGDIDLLFEDESEALTHPYLARTWAPKGADLRVQAPGQSRKRAIFGVLDHATGELMISTSTKKRSAEFIDFLDRLDSRFGTADQPRPLVLVLDNGPIHTSKASQTALAARPWITVEWLPKYAPELNDIERVWLDLKRHHLAHQTFADVNALDKTIHTAAAARNRERRKPSCLLAKAA